MGRSEDRDEAACSFVMNLERRSENVLKMPSWQETAVAVAVFLSLVFRDLTISLEWIASERSEGMRIRRW